MVELKPSLTDIVLQRAVVIRALLVALLVGTILNIINSGVLFMFAQQAWLEIKGTAKIYNHQKGAIEVDHKKWREHVKQGLRDAETCYNTVFARLERQTAERLLQIIPDATTEERRQAYAEMARRIRSLARRALHDEVLSRIPGSHLQGMRGY